MRRRALLAHGVALTPLASLLLAACGKKGNWPEGMQPFKWDRDTCMRCKMIISDRRFPVQIKGGPKNLALKFDDMGCAATWRIEKIEQYPWMTHADTKFWVADYSTNGETWLNALNAHYLSGKTSPMGYNYAAFKDPQPGSIDFAAMTAITSSFWPANCLPSKS